MLHGVGEVLQGDVTVTPGIIESWTFGPLAEHMGGDPGMTLLSDMRLTGILTLIFSSLLILWSVLYLRKRFAGLVQLLLTILMLLVGGGFGPPMLGILGSIAGMSIRSEFKLWRRILPGGFTRWMANVWPWVWGITAANGIFLVVGHILLVFVFGFTNPDVFVISTFVALVTIPLCTWVAVGAELANSSIIKE